MRKQMFIYVLIWCGYLFGGQELLADSRYHVKWVVDGDSIILQDGRHVRYIGINTPEIQHKEQPAEPFGDKAKSFNMKLVFQKNVHLEFDREEHDQYKRLLAYVFLKNGTFVNAKLVNHGYAFYLYRKPNLRYHALLLQSQREAMSNKKGIWQEWEERSAAYAGNKLSMRFHLPGCPFAKKIKPKNKINFSTKWDAFWAGYAPAKKCLAEWWRE
jgi:micrococcal nuclease